MSSEEGEKVYTNMKLDGKLSLELYKTHEGENEMTRLIESGLKHLEEFEDRRTVESYKIVEPDVFRRICDFCEDEGIDYDAWTRDKCKMKFLKVSRRMFDTVGERSLRTILITSRKTMSDRVKTLRTSEGEYKRKSLDDKDKKMEEN
jgi:hypothetical protein